MSKTRRTYCLMIAAVCLSLSSFSQSPEKRDTFPSPKPDSSQRQNPARPTPIRPTPIRPIPNKDTARLPLVPPSTRIVIGRIIVQGNRKTKTYIVERELSFQTGDTLNLEDLVKSFSFAHDRLINTHLFNDVVIFLKGFRGYAADIEIDVKERWYIFPVPYFKPVDRNLSAWAQKNYDLNRVNYGAKFSHFNFTGRNDNLTAWLITGYTRQFELYYNQPYADKSLKHGFGFGFTYAQNREIDALTLNNQQDFINSDSIGYAGKWLSQQFSFSARYFYRPGLNVRHFFALNMTHVDIDTAVTVVNKNYFDGGRREVLYPELSYSFNYTDVDYVAYPLKGVIFETGLTRRGIDAQINLWQIYAKLTRSWELGRKWYFGFESSDVLKLPLHQPFFNQQLIGYSDMYLRGLDRYVIDGVAGGILRNTLYRELFNFSIPFTHYASHDRIPIRIYATAFSDYGYSYNRDFPDNSLVNRLLYTAGVGLDLVTFYDLSFKFDYSFDQLGQNGLFLHIRDDF